MTKVCEVCGKEFEGNWNKRYCSDECKDKYRRERNKQRMRECREKNTCVKTKICEECGKEFLTEHGGTKYCSDVCRAKAKAKQGDEYYKKNRERVKEMQRDYTRRKRQSKLSSSVRREIVCACCGKTFEVLATSKNSRLKYCSEECRETGRKKWEREYHNRYQSIQREKEKAEKGATKTKSTKPKGRTFDSLVKEVKKYNEKHGTNLSYGQYQAKLYLEAQNELRRDIK